MNETRNSAYHYIGIGLGILAAVFLIWFYNLTSHKAPVPGDQPAAKPEEAKTATVLRQDVTPLVSVTVDFEPSWKGMSMSPLSGTVSKIHVKAGDKITAGQTLADLADVTLPVQASQAVSMQQSNAAALARAEAEVEKMDSLFRQGAVSARMLESAKARRDALQQQSAPSVQQSAAIPQQGTKITATRTGTVLKVLLPEGTSVEAGTPVFEVCDTATLIAREPVGIDYKDAFAPGSPVHIKVSDLKPAREFTGKLVGIVPNENISSQLQLMLFTVDNANGYLAPGTFALVDIRGTPVSQVLTVPAAAILEQNQQKYVYLITNHRLTRRPVRAVDAADGLVWILEGLDEGSTVALNPQTTWKDGDQLPE